MTIICLAIMVGMVVYSRAGRGCRICRCEIHRCEIQRKVKIEDARSRCYPRPCKHSLFHLTVDGSEHAGIGGMKAGQVRA